MPEKLTNNPERESSSKTEKPELKVEKPTQAQEKLERRAETNKDREKSAEKSREKIEKSLDKEAQERHEKQPKTVEDQEPKTTTRASRDAVFSNSMRTVRSQLSPAQRNFSKLIHAKPVEVTSELLEETIFRPSFLWGGVIGGILLGSSLYIFARIQGFRLSGSEFIAGVLVGGVIGLIVERLFRRKKTSK